MSYDASQPPERRKWSSVEMEFNFMADDLIHYYAGIMNSQQNLWIWNMEDLACLAIYYQDHQSDRRVEHLCGYRGQEPTGPSPLLLATVIYIFVPQ